VLLRLRVRLAVQRLQKVPWTLTPHSAGRLDAWKNWPESAFKGLLHYSNYASPYSQG
jgi:hypothetical protein